MSLLVVCLFAACIFAVFHFALPILVPAVFCGLLLLAVVHPFEALVLPMHTLVWMRLGVFGLECAPLDL